MPHSMPPTAVSTTTAPIRRLGPVLATVQLQAWQGDDLVTLSVRIHDVRDAVLDLTDAYYVRRLGLDPMTADQLVYGLMDELDHTGPFHVEIIPALHQALSDAGAFAGDHLTDSAWATLKALEVEPCETTVTAGSPAVVGSPDGLVASDTPTTFAVCGSFLIDASLQPVLAVGTGHIAAYRLPDGRTARLMVALEIESADETDHTFVTAEYAMEALGFALLDYERADFEQP